MEEVKEEEIKEFEEVKEELKVKEVKVEEELKVEKVKVKKEKIVKEKIVKEKVVKEKVVKEKVVKEKVVKEKVVKEEKVKEKVVKEVKVKKEKVVKEKVVLNMSFDKNEHICEIGIDEAGRGPMFGRVYVGCVVLPKDYRFDHSLMKDSKKFTSKKKINEAYEYIKSNAIAWVIEYEDEKTIDEINILQATQRAMHKAITKIIQQLDTIEYDNMLILVDGNYFKPFSILSKNKTNYQQIKYEMIEGGDNKFTSIAAASILAKVERDKYIDELCKENPELIDHYNIDSNKGYGSKKHMDGIRQFGITKWHRKTFGICKNF